jgi:hypothetical protein
MRTSPEGMPRRVGRSLGTARGAIAGLLGALCCCEAVEIGSHYSDYTLLGRADVEGLPAGSAKGTSLHGAYLFVRFETVRCECREAGSLGSLCDDSNLAWHGIWLDQADGLLEARLIEDANIESAMPLSGGVDADGRFVIGRATSFVWGEWDVVGQLFARVEGRADPGEGLQLRWMQRLQAIIEGDNYDCDSVYELDARFWDPEDASSCSLSRDCHPALPYCVQSRCEAGAEGDPCQLDDHCSSEAPHCVTDRTLTGSCRPPGDIDDPCVFEHHCLEGLRCTAESTCAP